MAGAGGASVSPLRLDPAAGVPLHRQLYTALREEVLAGRLQPGERLAASRVMAAELGISRNTVLAAVEQLVAEGYLAARVGAGTFVAHDLPEELARARPVGAAVGDELSSPPVLSRRGRRLTTLPPPPESVVRPFMTGLPAVAEFPRELWARLAQRRMRRLAPSELGYAEAAGDPRLRRVLAGYLSAVRGLTCEPEQVVVVAGSQQGLDLVARVLLDPGEKAWVEDPGYPGARAALAGAGAELVPVPVDGEGLDVEAGRTIAPTARLASVTPSHQYPLGVTLSLGRRLRLLEWAAEAGAWVLEDDYDSEYRYRGRPLAALKSLDAGGRVLYLGTFSKVLFPALRLGYLVLPPPLVEPFSAALYASVRHSPQLSQAVVADFIEEGHFGRHLRRMRVLYRRRQEALVAAVEHRLGDLLELEAAAAGLHLTGRLGAGLEEGPVVAGAAAAGVRVAALAGFAVERRLEPGLVLGYAAFSVNEIEQAVERLARVLDPGKGPQAST